MNSEFIINTTEKFNHSLKALSKKYPSLKEDLAGLRSTLYENPKSGTALGHNCYKIRLKISSKNTGKSGGGRVITYVKVEAKRITLLDIYDKSEKETIPEKELIELLKKVPE